MVKTTFANGHLKSFIDRIERMEEEKASIAADIKEIYAEAKGTGFDVKTIRLAIARRKKDAAALQKQDAMLDLYLGALEGTPLGEAATTKKAAAPKPKTSTATAPHDPETGEITDVPDEAPRHDVTNETPSFIAREKPADGKEAMELPEFMRRTSSPPQATV